MATINGSYGQRYQPVAEALARNLDEGPTSGRPSRSCGRRDGRRHLGWSHGCGADRTVERGHDRQRVLHHQDDDRAVRVDPGRSGELESQRPRRPLLARVRPGRQGADRGPPTTRAPAGLSGWEQRLAPEDLADWDRSVSLLAASGAMVAAGNAPWAITRSPGISRRRGRPPDHRPVARVRSSTRVVADPLRADFHIGLPRGADDRVAPLIPPSDSGDPRDARLGKLGAQDVGNPPIDRGDDG